MRSTPSLGLFLAVTAGLTCLFAVIVPWPGTFGDPGGGAAPGPDTPVRCLRLSYDGSSYRLMPATIRLHPEQYIELPLEAPWYRTSGFSGSTWAWRPAGPDSIDLSRHHGPVLRLPSAGRSVTGRGGWPDHENVLGALTSPEWRVAAAEVPCSQIPDQSEADARP